MQAAKIVYIGIFVLALLPLLFLSVKNIYYWCKARSKTTLTKVILFPASIVAMTVVLVTMYTYTLRTQPLLVAEREARAVLDTVDTAAWDGCMLQMPQQSTEEGDSRIYHVMLQNADEEKLVVSVTLRNGEAGDIPVLIGTQVCTGAEADDLVGRGMYFDVGIYTK